MTANEFFAPWERRDAVFSHEWTLKGRDNEIASLNEALSRPSTLVVMLTAAGGMGKSRVIKEVAAGLQAMLPHHIVRFLSTTSGEIDREPLESLGSRPKLLVVDDAHDRDGLGSLFEYVADPRNQAKLLLATRPYAEARINCDAAVYGIDGIPRIVLERLTLEQTTDLVKDVLAKFNGDLKWADEIVRATPDCPLVAIMAARIFARDRIPIELVKNDEDLRRLILGKFARVVTGELGSARDQRLIPGTLDVLALVQPFHIEDPQLVALLTASKGMDAVDVARILRLLLDGGIIYRRGHQYRLMPDLLGDYIIESSCIGPGDRLSPFAERVFDSVTGGQLANVLVNLGRLDWRRKGGDTTQSNLLENLWRKLEAVEDDHDPRLEAVRAVAIYQPRQALDFVHRQFDEGRMHREVSGIVRNIAFNYVYLDDACELLWMLGRDDKRELGPHPDHPIRVLSELCGFEESKPLEFTERVFVFGMSLIDCDGAWDYRYSPLDVLRPVLSGEGVTTLSQGRLLQMSSFFINFDMVSRLRRGLIDKILALLCHDKPSVGKRAAEFLDNALRAPMGLMGARPDKEVHKKYQLEFVQTLSQLIAIVASQRLHPGVMIAIARSVSWHAQYGQGEAAAVAQKVFKSLPSDLGFRIRAALADGFGRIFHGKRDLDRWQADQDAWVGALSQELKAAFSDGESLRHHLELAIEDLDAVRDSENSTHVLIGELLRNDLKLAKAFIDDAEARPTSATRRYVGAALHELLCLSVDEGRSKVRLLLGSGDVNLEYAAAVALGGLRRNVEAADTEVFKLALKSTNHGVKAAAVRSLWSCRQMDGRTLIDLALGVEIGESAELADEICMIFSGVGNHLFQMLSQEDVKQFLAQIENVPRLDGHWLEELLAFFSFRYPHDLAKFFFRRVELAATAETFSKVRAANHGPYAHVRLRINESPEAASVLQTTWTWLRENEHRNVYFQYAAADVFNAMFMSVDDAMVALFDAKIDTATKAELALMSRLLRNAPPDFIFVQRPFTVRFLERCRGAGKDRLQSATSALFASAISGVRASVLGYPAAQDLKMVEQAKQVLKDISRLSPAYRLFDGVRDWGEKSIARSVWDGGVLDDQ